MNTKVAIDPIYLESNQFAENFANCVDGDDISVIDGGNWRDEIVKAKILVIHWPREFMGATGRRKSLLLLARLLFQKRLYGVKIVWVAHNLVDHDSTFFNFQIWGLFLKLLDGIIYLSSASRSLVYAAYPQASRVRSIIVPHGVYNSAKIPTARSIEDGRQLRILTFGLIRPYKGLECLIGAMKELSDNSVELKIFGRSYDEAYSQKIMKIGENLSSIKVDIRDCRISDDEINEAIDWCDGVILPYRNILNSGSAMHALSRHRPILVCNKGSMPELQGLVGTEWVMLFGDQLSAADISRFGKILRSPRQQLDLSPFQWEAIGAQVRSFLKTLQV